MNVRIVAKTKQRILINNLKSEAMAKKEKKQDYIKDVFIPKMVGVEKDLPKTAEELTDYVVCMYEIIEEEKTRVKTNNNLN